MLSVTNVPSVSVELSRKKNPGLASDPDKLVKKTAALGYSLTSFLVMTNPLFSVIKK